MLSVHTDVNPVIKAQTDLCFCFRFRNIIDIVRKIILFAIIVAVKEKESENYVYFA